jgi:hypothetical protein
MDSTHLFALALALAWLAGLRVYLTVLAVGLAGITGAVELPPALAVCSSPWVLGVAGVLTLVEFSADKIPGVDSIWDLLHTLLRVPVGALLAGATLAAPGDSLSTLGLLAGGGAALFSHGLKSGSRVLINASPEPASNWTASLGEDALALTALWFVVQNPLLTLCVLVAASLLGFALVVWLLRLLARRLSGRRGSSTEPA